MKREAILCDFFLRFFFSFREFINEILRKVTKMNKNTHSETLQFFFNTNLFTHNLSQSVNFE